MRVLNEKCGVFGVFGIDQEAARTVFYGLWALQHRGQESSGIVSSDGQQLYRHVGPGLVANVYHEEDLEQLPGPIAIGHNRYSTSGGANDTHSQPILKRDSQFAFAHNGNIPVTDALEDFLNGLGVANKKYNDSEMMAEAIHCYMSDGLSLEEAIIKAYPLFAGAFSAVAMSKDKLVAFRDNCGIRPLSIGTLDDGFVVASETCALDTVGAKFLRDVRPGELVVIDKKGITSHQVVPGRSKLDIFEFVYFARPDSMLYGQSVNQIRQSLGKVLAREHQVEGDVVMPMPDSSIPAALGYAQATGIPFEVGLIKNRYIHRTFIRPTPALRDQDLKMKLNPMPDTMKGKRVILVDDSIVRGNTLRKVVKMVQEVGVKAIHIVVSSPPIKYPDFYGIDMPNQADLIAATMTPEQIHEHVGATSLGYLSYEGMIKATGLPARMFSTSCFSGIYPIKIGRRERDFVRIG